jgi:hypothetical protein
MVHDFVENNWTVGNGYEWQNADNNQQRQDTELHEILASIADFADATMIFRFSF